jgi:hypothetical protein
MGMVGVMETPGKQVPLETLNKTQDALEALQGLTGEKEAPIKTVIEQKVREYKGVPITRILFRVNPSAFTPQIFEQMKKIYEMIRYQVALSGDYFVMAGSDDQMNSVLDQVLAEGTSPAGRTLKARQYFPEGGSLYADIDLAGYIKFMFQIVSGTGTPLPFTPKTFEGVRQDPICLSIATQDREAHSEVRIPTGPIIDVVNAFKQSMTTQPVK